MKDKKIINFIISCVNKQKYEDKLESKLGDNLRTPPWKDGKKEYDDAIKFLKSLDSKAVEDLRKYIDEPESQLDEISDRSLREENEILQKELDFYKSALDCHYAVYDRLLKDYMLQKSRIEDLETYGSF